MIAARLSAHVALEPQADGNILAASTAIRSRLGNFSPAAAERAQRLRDGLPLASFSARRSAVDKEIDLPGPALARAAFWNTGSGLQKAAVIKSSSNRRCLITGRKLQTSRAGERIVLSRFAYLRRRGDEMVLESPRAGGVVSDCRSACRGRAHLGSPPRSTIGNLRRQDGFPGRRVARACCWIAGMLFRIEPTGSEGLRADEGDDNLVLWDFHDLLFHTHTTEGRQANPLGGLYPYAGMMRHRHRCGPSWPGQLIDLQRTLPPPSNTASPRAEPVPRDATRRAISTTTIRSRLSSCRSSSTTPPGSRRIGKTRADLGDGSGPDDRLHARPYPSGRQQPTNSSSI